RAPRLQPQEACAAPMLPARALAGRLPSRVRTARGAHSPTLPVDSSPLSSFAPPQRETLVESNGPLGILWVGVALGAFYIALIWLNTLLGFFLTPLFLIPQTWLMDLVARRRAARESRDEEHLSSY